jgi:F-type H+-transporting ATPase subunit gamma
MNLVAASKLSRAKGAMDETKPYTEEMRRLAAAICEGAAGISHRYLTERREKQSVIIVIAGDRGLAGGYNTNVCKAALEHMETEGRDESVIAVGSKARDFFVRRRKPIERSFIGVIDSPYYGDAAEIGGHALTAFETGDTDAVYLAYTRFRSPISHEPEVIRLLPARAQRGGRDRHTEFDSDPEALIDTIIPKYVNTVIYSAMLEASASEQGARMISMDAATDNADEMIEGLTLKFNRARQSAITQEITEIAAGADLGSRS